MENTAALEEKINRLECKLRNTIDILKIAVKITNGLNKDTTDFILDRIEELERN